MGYASPEDEAMDLIEEYKDWKSAIEMGRVSAEKWNWKLEQTKKRLKELRDGIAKKIHDLENEKRAIMEARVNGLISEDETLTRTNRIDAELNRLKKVLILIINLR